MFEESVPSPHWFSLLVITAPALLYAFRLEGKSMDFLRTLKKRRPKKHAPVKISVTRTQSRGIRIRRRSTTLHVAVYFALGLAVVTQGRAEDYYIYHDPYGKLVISNKEPPSGSKIIKQVPGVTDRQVPLAQEPDRTQSNDQPEESPKPSKSN